VSRMVCGEGKEVQVLNLLNETNPFRGTTPGSVSGFLCESDRTVSRKVCTGVPAFNPVTIWVSSMGEQNEI
jgi:hypothetical protein